MNQQLTALLVAGLCAFPALAADGPAKPTGGKEGVMMERSAGEERQGSVAQKGSKASAKMERSLGEEMKGMSPANVATKQAAKGAAVATTAPAGVANKGAAAMNTEEVVSKTGAKMK